MYPEFSYAADSLMTTAIGTVLAAGAAAGIAFVAVPKVSAFVLPRPKETHLSEFIPFDRLEPDGRTVVCRDGSLARFISISGIDQSFIKTDEAQQLFISRWDLFDALADLNVTLRIFTTRESSPAPKEGGYPNDLAETIARKWNDQFQKAFINRTVICFSVKGGGSRAKTSLEDAESIILSTLSKYHPIPLSQNPDESPSSDLTIGRFLGRMISPVSQPRPGAFGNDFADALAADEVEFLKSGRIRFSSGDDEKFASVIGIRRFGDAASAHVANELAAMPYESTILQTVEVVAKTRALITLIQQQKMMPQTSFSAEVADQYQAAIEMVEGMDDQRASLCHFSETIFLFEESLEKLKEAEKACRQILTNSGITSVVEKGASQVTWFMQFPTYELRPRVFRFMSPNVAQMSTFDRPPAGLPRSDWGEGPIARFYTGWNSVYSHQFHVSTEPQAVGHGLIIAPTGAGKTTLMEFLSLMASRHRNLKHFFFDRFHGTYVYTSAMGGKYLSFNSDPMPLSVSGGMNPLQSDETSDNTDFLKTWLMAIADQVREPDPDAIDQISQAIEINFKTLDKHERSLKAIYDGVFTPGTSVSQQLAKWVDDSQYGRIFNAEQDCIDLDGNWLTTFDMTNILSDDNPLAGPVVMYIMHRIRQTLKRNGAPGFIFIDETEPLLRDPNFRRMYTIMLQEFRKLSGVIISVFQRPNAIKASGISEIVRQQAGAYYLFQNPGASPGDYADFELSERELSFVLGESRMARSAPRSLLIKKPMSGESVVVDIDLSGLGPHLKIFSSGSTDVALATRLQQQFPEAWIEKYIDQEKA